jgi:uncharacterized protein (TIGR01244 family)
MRANTFFRHLMILLASLFLIALPTYADESVAKVSADEIRADAGAIAGASLVSSGQPDADILAIAREAGFTTVIDLRAASEDRGMDEAAVVEELGMQYVSLPVDGAAGVTFENAAALDKYLADADGPVFVHCKSGNRVGALFALRAAAAGASEEEAVAAGKAAGLGSLEKAVREQLAEAK